MTDKEEELESCRALIKELQDQLQEAQNPIDETESKDGSEYSRRVNMAMDKEQELLRVQS